MPRLALFLALAALLVCASLAAPSTSHAAAAKTGSGLSTSGLDVLAEVRSILGLTSQDAVDRATVASVLQRLAVWIESQLPAAAITEMRETVAAKLRADPTPQAPSVEFGFIPLFSGAAQVQSTTTLLPAPCFQSNTVRVDNFTGAGASLVLTANNASSFTCSDFYLIATLENVHLLDVVLPGDHTVQWTFNAAIKPTELSDIKRNGFRVFRFLQNPATSLYQLYETVMLFLPALLSATVPPACEQQNADFLNRTVQIQLERRATQVVTLDPATINSGDMFGILRLDGLDPMLAWAMGAHTGHTVVAVRDAAGALHLCEATTKDVYWPTNGVQCTPWAAWIAQAKTASHNVVHLPLAPAFAAKFNVDAAWNFFGEHEGHDYGYGNLLWGWQDNEQNYMYPLGPELHALLPGVIGKVVPYVADLLWTRAFNVRVGTDGLDTPDVYEQAFASHGWDFRALHWQEERDDFLYTMKANNGSTVKARSFVCNVFVCAMWKAAGLFADQPDFNCAETTNWDIETLAIFDEKRARPQACVDADPDLPYCQILGNYRVRLPFYNSRWPIPANHAFNNCPRGDSPDYNKPYPC